MAEKETAAQAQVTYLHHLRPAPGSNTPKTRVGRGEGSKGKTSGRGTKGTKARYQVPARFEGGQMPMHMRFPKGGTLGVDELVEAGLVRKNQPVKVLGTGEVSAKFDLTVDAWSESAKTKLEAQGGSLTAR